MRKGMVPMLAVLYSAGFIAAFNENIINVVLIDIMNAYAVSSTTAQWLVTGYMIVTAIVVSVMAFLSRRFGLRQLVIAGAVFLIVGSIGCFLAADFAVLLVFRLVQAVGTGIFIPTMMTTVLAVAPKQKLGTYLSIGGCCITFGPALSPVVSGLFATMFGWRFVFVTPACVVVIIAVAALFVMRDVAQTQRVKPDVVSVLASALGLVGLVYGLTELTADPLIALGAVLVGGVCLAFFVWRQTRLEDPILNLAPFSKRNFVFGCVLAVVAMMTTFSMSVILMLYFEAALGMSAFAAGALLLIPILFNAATAIVGGRVMDKRGPWPLLPLGFLVIVVGQAVVAATSYEAAFAAVVVGSVMTYAGVGLVFSPSQTAGLNSLARDEHASGVSIMNLFIQIAACIGPALFVGVLSSTAAGQISTGVSDVMSQARGFSAAVWVAAGVALVGTVVAFVFTRTYEAKASRDDSAPQQPHFSLTALMASDVYCVDDKATVAEAVHLLISRKTGSLPVVSRRGEVVGFVSDGDMIRYLTGGQANAPIASATALVQMLQEEGMRERIPELLATPVMDLAVHQVVSVNLDASFEEICKVLSDTRVKKVPVLDGRKLVGTVSRSDLMRSFLEDQIALAR